MVPIIKDISSDIRASSVLLALGETMTVSIGVARLVIRGLILMTNNHIVFKELRHLPARLLSPLQSPPVPALPVNTQCKRGRFHILARHVGTTLTGQPEIIRALYAQLAIELMKRKPVVRKMVHVSARLGTTARI